MNAKADTPKSAYPLNKQYKKYCIRCIPTLALSKSGYGSRPLSLLSACCRQAPHLFSCQVSQNNSCKTYGQLLSDVSSQTLSLTDDIIALHFFNCNISFRIFRIVKSQALNAKNITGFCVLSFSQFPFCFFVHIQQPSNFAISSLKRSSAVP